MKIINGCENCKVCWRIGYSDSVIGLNYRLVITKFNYYKLLKWRDVSTTLIQGLDLVSEIMEQTDIFFLKGRSEMRPDE